MNPKFDLQALIKRPDSFSTMWIYYTPQLMDLLKALGEQDLFRTQLSNKIRLVDCTQSSIPNYINKQNLPTVILEPSNEMWEGLEESIELFESILLGAVHAGLANSLDHQKFTDRMARIERSRCKKSPTKVWNHLGMSLSDRQSLTLSDGPADCSPIYNRDNLRGPSEDRNHFESLARRKEIFEQQLNNMGVPEVGTLQRKRG